MPHLKPMSPVSFVNLGEARRGAPLWLRALAGPGRFCQPWRRSRLSGVQHDPIRAGHMVARYFPIVRSAAPFAAVLLFLPIAVAASPRGFEADVLDELNAMRADPEGYTGELPDYRDRIDRKRPRLNSSH